MKETDKIFRKSKRSIVPDGKKKISINVPERLLIELDKYREKFKLDRSTWVTGAIIEKLASTKKEEIT